MENKYEAMKQQAIADCQAGRYEQAESALKSLLGILEMHGVAVRSTSTMFWYLVARNRGDEKRAMEEFSRTGG